MLRTSSRGFPPRLRCASLFVTRADDAALPVRSRPPPAPLGPSQCVRAPAYKTSFSKIEDERARADCTGGKVTGRPRPLCCARITDLTRSSRESVPDDASPGLLRYPVAPRVSHPPAELRLWDSPRVPPATGITVPPIRRT